MQGHGADFLVLRGESDRFGPVAIRLPWSPTIDDGVDEGIDAHALLRQEAILVGHLRGHGLPVPEVFALHEEEGLAFLVSTLVSHDGSASPAEDAGCLLRRLHEMPPPELVPVQQVAPTLEETLARLVARRTRMLAELVEIPFDVPDEDTLLDALSGSTGRRALLHMDPRPENLLARGGRIVAWVDWSNALIGDPALELARADEYAAFGPRFFDGYGETAWYRDVPNRVETVYRLYTAVMLALLFRTIEMDPDRARARLARVIELLDRL